MGNDIKDAAERFKQKLESGFYTSRREEAHKLAKQFEPDEPYFLHKEDRDTQAVKDFAKSEAFQSIMKNL